MIRGFMASEVFAQRIFVLRGSKKIRYITWIEHLKKNEADEALCPRITNRKSPQVVWIGWLGGRTSSSGNTGLFLAPAKIL